MPPTDFEGNTPPIEDLFYLLNTRLSFIRAGIAKQGKFYDGEDYECKPHEVFFEIHSKVHRHNRALVLCEIEDSLELIHTIQESIDKLPQEEERDTSHPWYVPIDNTMIIKEELENYKTFLEGLKENPILSRQNSAVLDIKEIGDKIPIQITIPQFSRLLSLFCSEDKRTDITKIFDSELSKICAAMITIFKQPDGKVISYKSLSDKKNNDKYKIKDLEFWRDRFKAYQILCANLILEEEKKNKNKKV